MRHLLVGSLEEGLTMPLPIVLIALGRECNSRSSDRPQPAALPRAGTPGMEPPCLLLYAAKQSLDLTGPSFTPGGMTTFTLWG